MKRKLGIIILSFLVVFYLLAITALATANQSIGSQDVIWTLPVKVTGQVIGDAVKVDTVSIGIDANESTFPNPGPPPVYTVRMYILGELYELLEDYKASGSAKEVWSLIIDVENSADASQEGFFPELSWDPNDIGLAHLMELRLGDETGAILVDDMRTTSTYQTEEAEALSEAEALTYDPNYSHNNNEALFLYTIVFELGEYAMYYEDDDGDGYGDPDYPFYYFKQLEGYVLNDNDCDDSDFYANPNLANLGIRDMEDEPMDDFELGFSYVTMDTSCSQYKSYTFLGDSKDENRLLNINHRASDPPGLVSSAYWFFGKPCGKNFTISADESYCVYRLE